MSIECGLQVILIMELPRTSTAEGGGPPNDQVVLHPFLYPHSLLKLPLNSNRNTLKKQLSKLIASGTEKQAQAFVASLEQARSALKTGLAGQGGFVLNL